MSKETSSVEDTEARSAMKLALGALTKAQNNLAPSKHSAHAFGDGELWDIYANAIKALEEALAKQEQRSVSEQLGEPLGTAGELFTNTALERLDFKPSTKIYTTPQQRKPLTFEQVEDCFCEGATAEENGILVSAQWLHDFARAIEAAHGIKE
jgi:hypothetical protein